VLLFKIKYQLLVPLSAVFLLLSSCMQKKEKHGVECFEGTWKLTTDNQYERWVKNDDGSFSSTVFSPNGKDSTVSEKVKVYKKGDAWCFETLVSGQNKGKSVVFTSTVLNDSTMQFENPTHDFPTIINYSLVSENHLRAFIAGKTDTIYFNYTRYTGK
jgi:hypothetical protein